MATAARMCGAMWLGAWLAVLAGAFSMSGCATYSSSFGVIENDLASQRYDAALKSIEQQSKSKNERALYLLNRGMVQRMQRDFIASNQSFEAAKAEMDRLYAASVSEHTLSFLVNDSTVSYGGEDYEQVLVHLYMALNYLELGQPGEARVEALQVDAKLREIGEKVSGNRLTDDAFSNYLAGLIYEDGGEWSDAMIAYRDAYNAYKKYQTSYGLPMPDMLKYDLLRMAKQQGLKDEVAQYRREFGLELKSDTSSEEGEVVFVLNNGLSPIKREQAITSVDPGSGTLVRIAVPYYQSRSNEVVGARISASGHQALAEMVEDIDAIARKSLDSHMPAIIARSVARAVIKTAAIKAATHRNGQNNNDAMIGLLGNLALQVTAVATERADTRSWLTLPANILMARLSLPPGSYTVKVELLGADGRVVATRDFPGVSISKARKTYLTQHWVPPQLPTARR